MSKNTLEELGVKSIVNYLRKSRQDVDKEKKTGEDTLHEQKQIMDRVLSEYGIPYDQLHEIGSGDKISTRPIFQQVVKDIEVDKYDSIAVKEISRMGRGSYTDMGIIYDLITEKRIIIVTPWKVYDPSNPSDLRQIRFELFMSREEFETTRERLNGGRYNSALEGNWISGAAPFGFDYNPNTKKLVINEEAEVVRTIFDLYANGIILENGKRKLVQFRALGTYLKRIGIKTMTGKSVAWAPNVLKYFLANERYIGTLKNNVYRETSEGKRVKNPPEEHIIVENAHTAIVNEDTWNAVQHRMNNRDTFTNTKLDYEPNRLAGICVCKKCGNKFIRRGGTQRYTKKDGSISVYEKFMLFCNTNGCTYVRYNAIEEDILETLKYLSDLDEHAFEAMVKQSTVNDKPNRSADDLKKYVESKKAELNRRMEFIHEKLESGVYDDKTFLERKDKLNKEYEDIEKIQINDSAAGNTESLNVGQTQMNIKTLLEAYQSASTNAQKNKLLHSVFDHIDVEITKKGSGTRPSVHQIDPYLKSSFLLGSS